MAKNDPFSSTPAVPSGTDPFGDPAKGGDRPKVRDMFGRLLLVSPTAITLEPVPVQYQKNGKTHADRLTADIVVLDGGPLEFGGDLSETPPIPHSASVEVPYKIEGLFISNVGLVSQCRDANRNRELKNGGHTMVLGRLGKGEKKEGQKAPWIIQPATDADKELARAYINSQNPFAS